MMAGRNLTALHPTSCFSLNARPRAPLYAPHSANLLHHLGRYERLPPFGRSAVGLWLSPLPPSTGHASCPKAPPEDFSRARTADAMDTLHAEAGLRVEGTGKGAGGGGGGGGRRVLAPDGALAYTQRYHVVDAQLRGYLERCAEAEGAEQPHAREEDG